MTKKNFPQTGPCCGTLVNRYARNSNPCLPPQPPPAQAAAGGRGNGSAVQDALPEAIQKLYRGVQEAVGDGGMLYRAAHPPSACSQVTGGRGGAGPAGRRRSQCTAATTPRRWATARTARLSLWRCRRTWGGGKSGLWVGRENAPPTTPQKKNLQLRPPQKRPRPHFRIRCSKPAQVGSHLLDFWTLTNSDPTNHHFYSSKDEKRFLRQSGKQGFGNLNSPISYD